MSLEEEFAAFYVQHFDALCNCLGRKFRRLNRQAWEDIAQVAYLETGKRIRAEGFSPKEGWLAYLHWLMAQRAKDYLRSTVERRTFEALSSRDGDSSEGPWEPADPAPSPKQILEEAERRGRQGILLSQILEEFCRRCEARPEMLKQKEVYERSLRGQKPAEIAAAMGISRGSVDVHLKRARDWVLERARQADVDRSVFLTLHRRKPEQ